jgi:hypothetical protein
MPNNFVSPNITQASPVTEQLLREIETAITSGGTSYNVNIEEVGGAAPNLATQTTLAQVNTNIATVSTNIGAKADSTSGAPSNAASLIAIMKGFWQWFIDNTRQGNGTAAFATRTAEASDSPISLAAGATGNGQATSSIVGGAETSSNGSIITLLKGIFSKTKGQISTLSTTITIGGGGFNLSLGGQTYQNFGIQVIATSPSALSAITINIFGSSVSTADNSGNFEVISTPIVIAPGVTQRGYYPILNAPVRTLRFSATGGNAGSTISIFVSCS